MALAAQASLAVQADKDRGHCVVVWFCRVGFFPFSMADPNFLQEVAKRRTFAIISHPDAGKTTITEKVLLFGSVIQRAGEVKGRGSTGSFAKSDWMAMEKERGISVTTSVMQFPYNDCIVNLLDTPGHEDFSEDTYRVLTAVDSCLMVIDAAGRGGAYP